MKEFKIKVKDVKEYVNNERTMYAQGSGKSLFITLRAGPNVQRYIVVVGDESHGFIKLGDAVRLFHDS